MDDLERIRSLHSKQRLKYYPTLSKLTPEQLSYYLLNRQKQFIASEAKNVALVAGFGSGKSRAGAYKAMLLAARNVGYKGILIANTYRQLKATLLTHFLYLCNARGIKYKHRKGDWELDVWPVDGQPPCSLKLVSASNIEPAVGDPNVAFAIADEVDRLKVDRAVEMHEQLTGRCRAGNFNQICYTSTPEGFQFLHKTFVADLTTATDEHKSRFQLVQGRSYDNPFHSTEWIMDMVSQFAPQLVAAYVEGQFVNLRSGTVYVNFDRDFNCSAYTINTFDNCTLHVGMDFNTGNMSAIIHVVDPKTGHYHAVDEIIGSLNTPALIHALKQRYPNRRLLLYPDASGSAHDSTANESDLTLLAAAGFPMKVNRSNPRIMDRVNSVNSLLLNIKGERRYYVNTRTCPVTTQAFEQQVYGTDGMPDKKFMIGKYKGDGVLDGIGYFVNQVAPLRARPTLTQIN